MNYHRIIEGILDIGEEMLKSGAENYRLEDALYRMLKSYGFIRYDVFVIPSNIQVSAKTPEGELITQIRHIESFENDFDTLDLPDMYAPISRMRIISRLNLTKSSASRSSRRFCAM